MYLVTIAPAPIIAPFPILQQFFVIITLAPIHTSLPICNVSHLTSLTSYPNDLL